MTTYTEAISFTSTVMETTENGMGSTQPTTTNITKLTTTTTTTPSSTPPSTVSVTVHSSTTTTGSPLPAFSSTTSPSHAPWKDVSFGLIGGIAVLLIILIIMCLVLRRLKRTLGKAQRTYYHETKDSDHSYTPLQKHETDKRPAPSVELRSVVHFEEEVDSPVFSPSPVTYPKPMSKPPPPPVPQTADTGSPPNPPPDIPPQLPTRRSQITLPSEKKNKKGQSKSALIKSADTDKSMSSGIDNEGFVKEQPRRTSAPTVQFAMDYGEDDDLYESYDNTRYLKTANKDDNGQVIDDITTYEEPIKSSTKHDTEDQFIKRQSSASGLPESVFKEATGAGANSASSSSIPLQDADVYNNADVDMKDSGLPADEDPQNLDDLATYEDLDDLTDPKDNSIDETEQESSDPREHTISSKDPDEEKYPDNASLSDTELGPNGTQYEPPGIVDMTNSLPEDPPPADNIEDSYPPLPDEPPPPLPSMPAPTFLVGNDDIDTDQLYDVGMISEQLEENLDETMLYDDFTNDMDSQNGFANVAGFDMTDAGSGDPPEPSFSPPKVPPRRTLSIGENKQNSNENLVANGIVNDDDSVTAAQLKSPAITDDILATKDPNNAYFIDVADNSSELSEQHQKRISVVKTGDQEVPLKELISLYGPQNRTAAHSMSDELMNISEHMLSGRAATGDMLSRDDSSDESDGVYYDDDLYDTPPPLSTQT